MDPAKTHRPHRAGIRVLLVEDVAFNSEILQGIFTEQGWQAVAVTSGEAALKALAADQDFDVILMDIGLPGMDGQEACQRIRSNPALAAIPILALSAETSREGSRFLAAGFAAYLEKTFAVERLVAAVEQLALRQQGAEQGPFPGAEAHGRAILRPELLLSTYGDMASVHLLAAAFFRDTGRLIARLKEAVVKKDRVTIRACCHSIQGAAAVFTAESLALAAENLAGQREQGQTEAALLSLLQEYQALRLCVRGLMSEE